LNFLKNIYLWTSRISFKYIKDWRVVGYGSRGDRLTWTILVLLIEAGPTRLLENIFL